MHRVSRAIVDSKYLRPDGAMATRYDDFVGETRLLRYQVDSWLCSIQVILLQASRGRQ
jgi:hypothetical protein